MNYNRVRGFLQNMDYDTIDYCGCGLTAIDLKLCMLLIDGIYKFDHFVNYNLAVFF